MQDCPGHKGNLALLPEKKGPTFEVGECVDISRDKQKGVNRVGGRARVTKAEGHGESERYQVQYVVGGGGEKNLPLTALTAVPEGPDEARTRKSLQAAIQPVAAREHQTVVDAHHLAVQRNRTLEQCVANRDAENQKLRSRLSKANARRRDVEREKANLLGRLEQERVAHGAEQAKVCRYLSHLQQIAYKSIIHM